MVIVCSLLILRLCGRADWTSASQCRSQPEQVTPASLLDEEQQQPRMSPHGKALKLALQGSCSPRAGAVSRL